MNRHLVILVLLLAATPVTATGATEITGELGPDKGLDFSLRFVSARNTLDYSGQGLDTTVKWISAGWREPFGPVQLGLRVGYTFVTQKDNPAVSGIELDGYHAGITLAFDVARFRQGRLFVSADYLYQRVKHEGASQTVELVWHDPRVTFGLYHALGKGVYGLLGASYGRISGEERIRNGSTSTRDFSRNDGGGIVGLDFHDSNRGTVGFVWRSGLDRGGSIYFKKFF